MTEVKAETRAEEAPEKKREKPKSLRTTAPSHAKFRSTGKTAVWPLEGLWVGTQPGLQTSAAAVEDGTLVGEAPRGFIRLDEG